MAESRPCSEARVVVGVDFGTTFSGFAVALLSDPEQIHTFYEWPMQERGGGKPYCKTQTSLLYVPSKTHGHGHPPPNNSSLLLPSLFGRGTSKQQAAARYSNAYELLHWGWPAQVAYLDNLQAQQRARAKSAKGQQQAEEVEVGHLVLGRVKLLLAGSHLEEDTPSFDPSRIGARSSDSSARLAAPAESLPPAEKSKATRRLWKRITPWNWPWLTRSGSSSIKPVEKSRNPPDHGQLKYVGGDDNSLLQDSDPEETFVAAGGTILGEGHDLGQQHAQAEDVSKAELLAPGMTLDRAISDFLGHLARFAVEHLQSKYGSHITMREVQWCLTVPAIWDDAAKQEMIRCAESAGMVTGQHCPAHMMNAASPHPIQIVLESEAASLYCYRKTKHLGLRKGDEFVVADVGGGTVDIVVHSQADNEGSQLREVAESSGGLCGGTYVDRNFISYLLHRIPCFRDYVVQNPAGIRNVTRRWEEIKCGFDGSCGAVFQIPSRLAAAWKNFDSGHHNISKGAHSANNYDELEITSQDMKVIFDPVVDKVVELIKAQLRPGIRALMLVGGFSASPYLMKRIREQIGSQVTDIINPPEPGSAICQGAVICGLQPHTMLSRIARKTYGTRIAKPFDPANDPIETLRMNADGLKLRLGYFSVVVKRGDVIQMNDQVSRPYYPLTHSQAQMAISIYSSDQVDPQFVTDSGVKLEGEFPMDVSHDPDNLGVKRRVKASMHFGRSYIQLTAQRLNFGNTDEVVKLHHSVPLQSCAAEQAAYWSQVKPSETNEGIPPPKSY